MALICGASRTAWLGPARPPLARPGENLRPVRADFFGGERRSISSDPDRGPGLDPEVSVGNF
jgi:hypothetical protein